MSFATSHDGFSPVAATEPGWLGSLSLLPHTIDRLAADEKAAPVQRSPRRVKAFMRNNVRFHLWKPLAEQFEMTVRGDNRAQYIAAGMALLHCAAVLDFIELTAL